MKYMKVNGKACLLGGEDNTILLEMEKMQENLAVIDVRGSGYAPSITELYELAQLVWPQTSAKEIRITPGTKRESGIGCLLLEIVPPRE